MVIMMTLIMLMMVMTLIYDDDSKDIDYDEGDETDTDYADDSDDPDLALQEVLVGRLQTGRDSQQLATSPFNCGQIYFVLLVCLLHI